MSCRVLLASLVVLLVSGCTQPRVVPIIGPDGSRMLHVSCGDREGECYRLAGEHCPYGYDVGRTIAGSGNMLVRCRTPAYSSPRPAYTAYAATPVPANATPTPAYTATSTPGYTATPAPAYGAAAYGTSPAPPPSATGAAAPAPSGSAASAQPKSVPFDLGY